MRLGVTKACCHLTGYIHMFARLCERVRPICAADDRLYDTTPPQNSVVKPNDVWDTGSDDGLTNQFVAVVFYVFADIHV
jgi:hypothetical protein